MFPPAGHNRSVSVGRRLMMLSPARAPSHLAATSVLTFSGLAS
jgi:hypothetical protein